MSASQPTSGRQRAEWVADFQSSHGPPDLGTSTLFSTVSFHEGGAWKLEAVRVLSPGSLSVGLRGSPTAFHPLWTWLEVLDAKPHSDS